MDNLVGPEDVILSKRSLLWAPFDGQKPYRVPTQGSDQAGAWDLYVSEAFDIGPGETVPVHFNLICVMPSNLRGQIVMRSSSGSKEDLILVSGGLMDSDYPGEWYIFVHKLYSPDKNRSISRFKPMDRICQVKFEEVPELRSYETCKEDALTEIYARKSSRSGGFGSTGT